MEGLSPETNSVIESFSSLEILKEYYLVGGTSLAIQIQHRLSEDLDFCQWIPTRDVRQAIPTTEILRGLQERFTHVDENRLDFHQVNYLVKEPTVRITFYQTTLAKPVFNPIHIVGNIYAADLSVLGGSKMYVVTQRYALRDYYDLYVLVKEDRLSVQQMLQQALIISRDTTPKILFDVFSSFSFDGNRFKLSDLDKLKPRYAVTADEYIDFCRDIAKQIQALHPDVVVIDRGQEKKQRTSAHLIRKIESTGSVLADMIINVKARFGLHDEELDVMIAIGPYESSIEEKVSSLNELTLYELEDLLDRRSGAVKNLLYNVREKYSLSRKALKELRLTSH